MGFTHRIQHTINGQRLSNCLLPTSIKAPQVSRPLRSFCNKIGSSGSNNAGYSGNPSRLQNFNLHPRWQKLGLNASPIRVGFSGFFSGIMGGLCGVGGGIVMIPLLRHFTRMTSHQIAGTSLVAVCMGAMWASYGYSSQGVTRVPIAISMAMCSILFSGLGAMVSARMSGIWLSRVTGICMLGSIYPILAKSDSHMRSPHSSQNLLNQNDNINNNNNGINSNNLNDINIQQNNKTFINSMKDTIKKFGPNIWLDVKDPTLDGNKSNRGNENKIFAYIMSLFTQNDNTDSNDNDSNDNQAINDTQSTESPNTDVNVNTKQIDER